MTKTKNDLVTKTYLDRRLYKLKKELKNEIGEDMEDLKLAFKDEVIGFKDEVLGEIKKLREDDEAHRFSHMRINDELQEYSKQIAQLQSQ